MLNYLKQETNKTKTTNGDTAFRSTMDELLDLFSNAATLRNKPEEIVKNYFTKAFYSKKAKDKLLVLKCLFYIRDIQEGLGERRVFRIMMKELLSGRYGKDYEYLINLIPEYGRWDDVLVALDTPAQDTMVKVIKNRMKKDIKALREGNIHDISLMAKWMPKEDTSSASKVKAARKLASLLKLPSRKYRKNLTELRKAIGIIETSLTKKDYTFKYEHVPSLAMFKYKKAFARNDKERYEQYLEDVRNQKKALNTKVLAPYQITRAINKLNNKEISETQREYLDNAWNNLPDYAGASNALAVIDVSGSMVGESENVAQALGIYFAEHNKGYFHNHFILFSGNPQLIELHGNDIIEKVKYVKSYSDYTNTNIEKTYRLILDTAVKHNLPQSELPEKLYIISDMQFDEGSVNNDLSVFRQMQQEYEKNGYKLPNIIFWKVGEYHETFPVTKNEQGVISVSGFNTNLFKMIEENNFNYNPYDFMMKILKSTRYEKIKLPEVKHTEIKK